MFSTLSWAISLFFIPLAWLAVDALGGIRARHSAAVTVGSHQFSDFSVLVPIYGNVRYLENVDYLATYADRVLLCTTTGESDEFDDAIDRIALEHGFRVSRTPADNGSTTSGKRATGGTIRDTVIRDALHDVTTKYVVCIDADTTTTQPLEFLAGALEARGLDLASIRLIPSNRFESLLTRLQAHEYRLAMRLRIIAPWLVSGACHAGRTTVLRQVMDGHSLFFQGNDVETGVLAHSMGFRVGHVPFEVPTAVPNTIKAWWRQHVAWAGGEFRLFVMNVHVGFRHPFFWTYGLIITLAFTPLRWLFMGSGQWRTALVLIGLYVVLGLYLQWRDRDYALLLMPLYAAFISIVLVPLGVASYIQMAWRGKNPGIIHIPLPTVQTEPEEISYLPTAGARHEDDTAVLPHVPASRSELLANPRTTEMPRVPQPRSPGNAGRATHPRRPPTRPSPQPRHLSHGRAGDVESTIALRPDRSLPARHRSPRQ